MPSPGQDGDQRETWALVSEAITDGILSALEETAGALAAVAESHAQLAEEHFALRQRVEALERPRGAGRRNRV